MVQIDDNWWLFLHFCTLGISENFFKLCFVLFQNNWRGFNNSSFHALLIRQIKELYKIFASKYAPQSKFLEGIFLSVKFGAHSEGVTKTP